MVIATSGRQPNETAQSSDAISRSADDRAAALDDWDAPVRTDPAGEAAADDGEALLVEVDGFSGPLDLLLALARTQKLDLTAISIVALVDQYLVFIEKARALRLELAGDYLVMAAWLAFLKSRLLIPKQSDDDDVEIDGEEMARRLAFRLKRLEAMRNASESLLRRPRLGRDVFARGAAEPTKSVRTTVFTAELYDLLSAYAQQRRRTLKTKHIVRRRPVWSIKDARQRLERLVGKPAPGEWLQLDLFLAQYLPDPEQSRTVLAASFGASLEMVREGVLEIRQDRAFSPLLLRRRPEEDTAK